MLHGCMRLRLLGFLWIPHGPSTQTAREPGILTWHRRDFSTKISFRPSEGLSLIISHYSYTVSNQICSYFQSFRNQMVPFFFKGFSIIVVHCSSKGTTRGDMATAWLCRQCRQCQVSKGSCKSFTWRSYRCGKMEKNVQPKGWKTEHMREHTKILWTFLGFWALGLHHKVSLQNRCGFSDFFFVDLWYWMVKPQTIALSGYADTLDIPYNLDEDPWCGSMTIRYPQKNGVWTKEITNCTLLSEAPEKMYQYRWIGGFSEWILQNCF